MFSTTLRRSLFICLQLFFSFYHAVGQSAVNYAGLPNGNFSHSNGTFNSIVSTGIPVTFYDSDNSTTGTIPIGFDFLYMGTIYRNCFASTNGYLSFGDPTIQTSASGALNNSSLPHPVIAPYIADLQGQTNVGYYQLSGVIPNRVFTFEWANWGVRPFTSPASFSMQVKLYEGSGAVEFVYNSLSGNQQAMASIGLSLSQSNYVGLLNVGTTPVAAASYATISSASRPVSGRIFRFTPSTNLGGVVSISAPTIKTSNIIFNGIQASIGHVIGYRLMLLENGIPFRQHPSIAKPPGNFTINFLGLKPATNYQLKVMPLTEGNVDTVGYLSQVYSTLPCNSMSGIYTIGPSGNFPGIKSAFDSLMIYGANGDVVFELQSGYTGSSDPSVITLADNRSFESNPCQSAPTSTITIRPQAGVSSLTLNKNFSINSFINLIIDGRAGGMGTSRNLTLSNQSIGGAIITYSQKNQGCSIQYCNIVSAFSGTNELIKINNTQQDSIRITIASCEFNKSTTGVYQSAIYIEGSIATDKKDAFNIHSCSFNNFSGRAVFIDKIGRDANCVISGNHFYFSDSTQVNTSGSSVRVNINASNNLRITNNFIGGRAPFCAGAQMFQSVLSGIEVINNTSTLPVIVWGNTIKNIQWPNTSLSSNNVAINISGSFLIEGNSIGDSIDSQSLFYKGLGSFFAINAVGSGIIRGNYFSGLRVNTALATNTVNITGIRYTNANSSQIVIDNNKIRNIHSNGVGSIFGINSGGSGTLSTTNIYSNIIEGLKSTNMGTQVVNLTGIYVNSGKANVSLNKISSLSIDSSQSSSTPSVLCGIYVVTNSDNLLLNNQISRLAFRSNNVNCKAVLQGIFVSNGTDVKNNIIRALSTTSATTETGATAALSGIIVDGGTSINKIEENTIDSLYHLRLGAQSPVASTLYGIWSRLAANSVISKNTIKNLVNNSTGSEPIVGILQAITSGEKYLISGNEICNFVNTNTTAVTGVIYGILVDGLSPTTGIGYRINGNRVHSFRQYSTAAAGMIGINIKTGNVLTSNNMIRLGIDSSGIKSTGPYIIYGIRDQQAANVPSYMYHNSIYISSAPTSGSSSTAALCITSLKTIRILNNILVDSSLNAGGTAKHYGILVSSPPNSVFTSDYNVIYTPNANGFVANNGIDYATLSGASGWKYLGRRDKHSFQAYPNFVNITGSGSQLDMRLLSSNVVEQNGDSSIIDLVPTDIDDRSRAAHSPADIGASCGNYTLSQDFACPQISYTLIKPVPVNVGQINLLATITDQTGVYTSGALTPRVYFRKNLGAWVSAAGILLEGNGRSGQWQFTLNHSALSVTGADSIQYYVIAQDSFANINTNPGVVVASDVNNVLNHPVTLNAYRILNPMPNIILVGNFVGSHYTSLTNSNGAFNAINNGILVQNTTILVDGFLGEGATVALNPIQYYSPTGESFSLTIRPRRNVVSTIACSGNLIINGADNITFMGMDTSGNANDTNLVIRATVSERGVVLQNDASNIEFRNVIFQSFLFAGSHQSSGNDKIEVNGCHFRQLGTTATYSTFIGSSSVKNDSLIIRNCTFNNPLSNAISLLAGTSIRIIGNHIFGNATSTMSKAITCILDTNSVHDTIVYNYIGGTQIFAQGSQMQTSSGGGFEGISITSSNSLSNVVVVGNVIRRITLTAGNLFNGISFSSGSGVVQDNMIGDTLSVPTTSIVLSHSASGLNTTNGILVNSTNGDYALYGNVISRITRTTAGSLNGILVQNGVKIIQANRVQKLANSLSNSTSAIFGIYHSGSRLDQISDNNIDELQVLSSSGLALCGIHLIQTKGNTQVLRNRVANLNNANNAGTAIVKGLLVNVKDGAVIDNTIESITNTSTATGSDVNASITALEYFINSDTAVCSGNTICNINNLSATAASSQVIGVNARTASYFTNNKIYGLRARSSRISVDDDASIIGLLSSGIMRAENNSIYHLENLNSTSNANVIYGIRAKVGILAKSNRIYGIKLNTTGSGAIGGMNISGSIINSKLENNEIRLGIDSSGVVYTAPYALSGILYQSSKDADFLHNTIYLAGNNTSGSSSSHALRITNNAALVRIKNNIFTNLVTNVGGTGTHYGLWVANKSRTFSDYNIFFVNGTGGVVAGESTRLFPRLKGQGSWRIYSGSDYHSGEGNPVFVNPVGNSNNFSLMLAATNAVEGQGDTSLIDEVNNDIRSADRKLLTSSDIGCYASKSILGMDIFDPTVDMSNIRFLFTPQAVGLSGIEIADNFGVYLTGLNAPKLYYKKGINGMMQLVQSTGYSGTRKKASFDFLIQNNSLFNAVPGDTIYYFILASDTSGRIVSMPEGATANRMDTLTSAPNVWNHFVVKQPTPIPSRLYVGVGQAISSLSNRGGLFDYLNQRVLTNDVTVLITSDLAEETGVISLNEFAVSPGSIKQVFIKPDSSTTQPRLVRNVNWDGSSGYGPIISIKGADHLKISGIPDQNTDTTLRLLHIIGGEFRPAIKLEDGVQGFKMNNVILACRQNFMVANPFSGIVHLGNGKAGQGNSYDTIQNCLFRNYQTFDEYDTIGITPIAIYSSSDSIQFPTNSNNCVQGNHFKNIGFSGVYLNTTSGDGWTIEGNHFYYDFYRPLRMTISQFAPIYINTPNSSGHRIVGNYIGGKLPFAAGDYWDAQLIHPWNAIYVNASTKKESVIAGNRINNFRITTANTVVYSFSAIKADNGSFNISGNYVGDSTGGNGIIAIANLGTHYGVQVGAASTVRMNKANLSGNTFSGITGINAWSLMYLFGGSYQVENNTFSNVNIQDGSTGTEEIRVVEVASSSNILIKNNHINRIQSSHYVSGFHLSNSTYLLMENNTVENLISTIQTSLASRITFGGQAHLINGALINSISLATIRRNFFTSFYHADTVGYNSSICGITFNGIYTSLESNTISNLEPYMAKSSSRTIAPLSVYGVILLAEHASLLNNQIFLGNRLARNIAYEGVRLNGVTNLSFNHNSIILFGKDYDDKINSSYCIKHASGNYVDLTYMNNALINARTSPEKNFVVGLDYSNGLLGKSAWKSERCNYNFYAGATRDYLFEWGVNPMGFDGWQGIINSDIQSWYIPTGNELPYLNIDSLYPGIQAGILHPNVNARESWFLNGKGINTGLTRDINDGSRSIEPNFGADIGAVDFTPMISPPNASEIRGSRMHGGTEDFYFASRKIATIQWGSTGTLPVLTATRLWTGVSPSDSPSTTGFPIRKLQSYLDFQSAGGNGYTYNITYYYDDALLGRINQKQNIRGATMDSASGRWRLFPNSAINENNQIIILGQSRFNAITGVDTSLVVPLISGSKEVCVANQYIYQVSTNHGRYYKWVVSGGNILNGQGTASLTVQWNQPGIGQLWVTDSLVGTFVQSTSAVFNVVKSQPVANNQMLTPSQSLCKGSFMSQIACSKPSGGDSLNFNFQWIKSTTSSTSGFELIQEPFDSAYIPGALHETTWYRRIVQSGACSADTSLPLQVTVNERGIWTGNVNNDWANPANWSCPQVPSANSNALIPGVVSIMPVINSNQSVFDIKINQGASLTFNSTNAVLQINGDFINEGNLQHTAGRIIWGGKELQAMPGGTYHAAIVKNKSDVSLSGHVVVRDSLVLDSGLLRLNQYHLTLPKSASVSQGHRYSYIQTNGVGVLKLDSAGLGGRVASIQLPIGRVRYNPLLFSNTGVVDEFSFAVIDSVYGSYTGNQGSGSAVQQGALSKTWFVNELNPGGSQVGLTVYWYPEDEMPSFSRMNCNVSQFNGSLWASSASGSAVGSGLFGRSISSVTTVGPFSVGSGTILPVHLLSFNVTKQNNTVLLHWETTSEKNNRHFVIEHSFDGVNYQALAKVPGKTVSNQVNAYIYTDLVSLDMAERENASNIYYRLRQIDYDGSEQLSEIRMLSIHQPMAQTIIYPNPFHSTFTVDIDLSESNVLELTLIDTKGEVVFSQAIDGLTNGLNSIQINDLQNVPSGLYILQLTSGSRAKRFKVIKTD